MKLQMIGCGGERTCDWRSYALLRDNVLHYVESGVRSGRFRALHALARAVDSGACTVDAVRLRHETLAGFDGPPERAAQRRRDQQSDPRHHRWRRHSAERAIDRGDCEAVVVAREA